MKAAVLKFGGTSVATAENRQRALLHVIDAQKKGYSIVVIVSAMGRKGEPYATDTLLSLLGSGSSMLTRDLLISCGETISACVMADMFETNNILAKPLTGAQAGILTNGAFGRAKITNVDTSCLAKLLKLGQVPIVAGFQGASDSGDTVTLGRGGSDISAVIMGKYLDAEYVDIFTDVRGVAMADPRIVPSAPYLDSVAYDDIHLLSSWGANVIHPEAVDAAKQCGITVRVRSTLEDNPGTILNSDKTDGLVGCSLLKNCKIVDSNSGKGLSFTDEHVDGLVVATDDGGLSVLTVVYRPLDKALSKLSAGMELDKIIPNKNNHALHIIIPNDQAETTLQKVFNLLHHDL